MTASAGEYVGLDVGGSFLKGAGVGIGLPGIVDIGSGRLRSAPNLSALNGLDLAAEISQRTGRRSFPENDANAAALAEAWLGAGRDAETVLLVTLGTGIGGGLVFHGRIWAGRSGYAGEIGHLQVDPEPEVIVGAAKDGGVRTAYA